MPVRHLWAAQAKREPQRSMGTHPYCAEFYPIHHLAREFPSAFDQELRNRVVKVRQRDIERSR